MGSTGETPGSDDFDIWFQGIVCKFKTDLIVALAGASVGDCFAAFFLGNLDLAAGNHWTSKRCAEKIDTL